MDNQAKAQLADSVANQLHAVAGERGDLRPVVCVRIVDTDPGPGGPYLEALLSFRVPIEPQSAPSATISQ